MVVGMRKDIAIYARWDSEAEVWLVTSAAVPDLVIEAQIWPAMIEEVRLILPDLLKLNGQARRGRLLDLPRGGAPGPCRGLMAELYRQVVAILREHGCTLVRSGKVSHEIWFSPANGRHVTVPRSTRSRHTANEVSKQAGLPKTL
jgi:hypothetical protein